MLITELVRGAWLQYIRRYNAQALGTNADLAEFLFGSERTNVGALRPVLTDLQTGQRFYCRSAMRSPGCIDHFVPWARYPVDLGHNFVLAHDSCNAAKGMILAAEPHLASWAERNAQYGNQITKACGRASVAVDLSASVQIARWAYAQAFEAYARTWVRKKVYAPLTADWERALRSAATSSPRSRIIAVTESSAGSGAVPSRGA